MHIDRTTELQRVSESVLDVALTLTPDSPAAVLHTLADAFLICELERCAELRADADEARQVAELIRSGELRSDCGAEDDPDAPEVRDWTTPPEELPAVRIPGLGD